MFTGASENKMEKTKSQLEAITTGFYINTFLEPEDYASGCTDTLDVFGGRPDLGRLRLAAGCRDPGGLCPFHFHTLPLIWAGDMA